MCQNSLHVDGDLRAGHPLRMQESFQQQIGLMQLMNFQRLIVLSLKENRLRQYLSMVLKVNPLKIATNFQL